MPEFTSPWLETAETPSRQTDSTDSKTKSCLAVSAVSDTTRHKQPFQKRDATAAALLDEVRAIIAEIPPANDWNIAQTAGCTRAMSDAERTINYAALIHDWRAWLLATATIAETAECTK
jgi:hypothetical protein